jgi:hypothetical protein
MRFDFTNSTLYQFCDMMYTMNRISTCSLIVHPALPLVRQGEICARRQISCSQIFTQLPSLHAIFFFLLVFGAGGGACSPLLLYLGLLGNETNEFICQNQFPFPHKLFVDRLELSKKDSIESKALHKKPFHGKKC